MTPINWWVGLSANWSNQIKKNLLKDLATRHVGPLAITDLEVKLKLSDEVSQVVEMSTQTTLVDSVGL